MATEIDTLLSVCRVVFPSRQGMAIRAINPLQSTHHAMTAFHLVWEEGDRSLQSMPMILRRYSFPPGWRSFDDADRAGREAAMLVWLTENGFPAPPVYGSGNDESGEWLLEGAIHGHPWWYPPGGVDFAAVLPGISRQMVGLLARLHSMEPGDLAAHIPTITVAGTLDVYQHAAQECSDPLLESALKRVRTMMVAVEERPPRMIHGDSVLANLLVDDHYQVAGWLDWDDAGLGDPRWDVAALVTSLRGDYQMNELADRALADYARETVRPVQNIRAWVAMIAVFRWVQSTWIRAMIRSGKTVEFPGREMFTESCDSHRAWAMEMLQEAEEEEL
jgi:aminoglycoside phosphotransferase (APT) family kinase protein